ncbi:hypothetical protein D1Y78_02515 [Riemerella anatipestifer]|nr:hypothetical protein [Riemerella anatipestifer]
MALPSKGKFRDSPRSGIGSGSFQIAGGSPVSKVNLIFALDFLVLLGQAKSTSIHIYLSSFP